jgi:hypothetical protein
LLPVLIGQNSAVLPPPRLKLLLRFLNGSEFGLSKAFGLAHLVLALGPRRFIPRSLDPHLPLPLKRRRF